MRPKNKERFITNDGIFDYEDPLSPINMLVDSMRGYVERAKPILAKGHSDETLLVKVPTKWHWILKMMRHAFWTEYQRAVDDGANVVGIKRVITGVCNYQTALKIMDNQYACSYMFTPPPKDTMTLKALLEMGYETFRQILSKPLLDHNGKLDHKLIDQKIKITQTVENRLKGMNVQRVESKSLKVNIDNKQDPKQIEEEIKKLKEEMGVVVPTTYERVAGEEEGA